jgi:hypothetical protein
MVWSSPLLALLLVFTLSQKPATLHHLTKTQTPVATTSPTTTAPATAHAHSGTVIGSTGVSGASSVATNGSGVHQGVLNDHGSATVSLRGPGTWSMSPRTLDVSSTCGTVFDGYVSVNDPLVCHVSLLNGDAGTSWALTPVRP